MVLFGRASFLTGVIAAQSQQRAEKVGASPKIGNVTKKLDQGTLGMSDPLKWTFLKGKNWPSKSK